MTTTRRRAALVCLLALSIGAMSRHAAADDDDPRPGEGGSDIAIPDPTADLQVAPQKTGGISAESIGAQPEIDDFRYDDLITEGTAAEVCYGALRSGTLACTTRPAAMRS